MYNPNPCSYKYNIPPHLSKVFQLIKYQSILIIISQVSKALEWIASVYLLCVIFTSFRQSLQPFCYRDFLLFYILLTMSISQRLFE